MAKKTRIGGQVICTYAASNWYKVGHVYDVVEHPDGSGRAIQASDGLYDLLSLVNSQFDPVIQEVERVTK